MATNSNRFVTAGQLPISKLKRKLMRLNGQIDQATPKLGTKFNVLQRKRRILRNVIRKKAAKEAETVNSLISGDKEEPKRPWLELKNKFDVLTDESDDEEALFYKERQKNVNVKLRKEIMEKMWETQKYYRLEHLDEKDVLFTDEDFPVLKKECLQSDSLKQNKRKRKSKPKASPAPTKPSEDKLLDMREQTKEKNIIPTAQPRHSEVAAFSEDVSEKMAKCTNDEACQNDVAELSEDNKLYPTDKRPKEAAKSESIDIGERAVTQLFGKSRSPLKRLSKSSRQRRRQQLELARRISPSTNEDNPVSAEKSVFLFEMQRSAPQSDKQPINDIPQARHTYFDDSSNMSTPRKASPPPREQTDVSEKPKMTKCTNDEAGQRDVAVAEENVESELQETHTNEAVLNSSRGHDDSATAKSSSKVQSKQKEYEDKDVTVRKNKKKNKKQKKVKKTPELRDGCEAQEKESSHAPGDDFDQNLLFTDVDFSDVSLTTTKHVEDIISTVGESMTAVIGGTGSWMNSGHGQSSTDEENPTIRIESQTRKRQRKRQNRRIQKKTKHDFSTTESEESDDNFISDPSPSNRDLRPRPDSRDKLDDSGASDDSLRDKDWSVNEVRSQSPEMSKDDDDDEPQAGNELTEEETTPVEKENFVLVPKRDRKTKLADTTIPEDSLEKRKRWCARQRSLNADAKRRRKPIKCPVDGCPCFPTRLMQHLKTSKTNPFHAELSKQQMQQLILRVSKRQDDKPKPKEKEASKAKQRTYAIGKCPLCSWTGPRFYRHLSEKHKDYEGDKNALRQQARVDARSQNAKAKQTGDTVLEEFRRHLLGLEGGMVIPEALSEKQKQEKTALVNKHVQRVGLVIKQLLGNQFELSDLGNLRLWSKRTADGGCYQWLRMKRTPDGEIMTDKDGNQLMNTAGHLANIACSMTHMHRFLSQKRYEYSINKESLEVWRDVQTTTMKSLKAEVATEYQQNTERRAKEVVPLFMLAGYMESVYMRETMDIMDKYIMAKKNDESKPFNKDVHSRAVRALALALQLLNFKRPGPLCDFRITELERGTILELSKEACATESSGKLLVCRIHDGKTYKKHGSAQLAMPETFAETLKQYCRYIRPTTNEKTDNDYVFVYRKGGWMDSSEMQKQLKWAWKEYCVMEETNEKYSTEQRALFAKKPRITSSIFRRSIITHFRENEYSEEGKAFLARHMDHRLETAESYYNMSCKDRATTVAMDLVACMFRKEVMRLDDMQQTPYESDTDEENPEEVVDMADYEAGMNYMARLKNGISQKSEQKEPKRDVDADLMKIAGDFINQCVQGERQCDKRSVMQLFQEQPRPFRYFLKWEEGKLHNKVRNKVQTLKRKLQREKLKGETAE